MIPHPIAVDNYFVDRELTPRDADGNYDFECLEAIDVEQFNRDMQDLLDGKEVYLPIFNFKTGKRMRSSVPKKLGEQDIALYLKKFSTSVFIGHEKEERISFTLSSPNSSNISLKLN